MAIVQVSYKVTPYLVKDVVETFTVRDMVTVLKEYLSMGYKEPVYTFKDGDLLTNSREFAVLVDNY
jgi:hypothetical protein